MHYGVFFFFLNIHTNVWRVGGCFYIQTSVYFHRSVTARYRYRYRSVCLRSEGHVHGVGQTSSSTSSMPGVIQGEVGVGGDVEPSECD